ncbi:MAG: TorF family putative porin [Pseudomonadales bacterium]
MKKLLASSVIAAAAFAGVTAPAMGDVSANVGFVTDYYYRGLNLGDAGMDAGIDYEQSGFYVGAWAIDDGVSGNGGMEYDIYFGYGLEVNGVSLGIGYTSYQYTYTSDQEDEINLSVGYGQFSFDYAVGEDSNDSAGISHADYDYDFYSLSWSGDIFAAVVGHYDSDKTTTVVDAEYSYIELSASGEISGFDISAIIGTAFDTEVGGIDIHDTDGYMLLDVSKTFDL